MSQQNKFIHLFVQHYEAKSPVGRQDEINDALRKNLAHPNVARVYYLSEHLGTASNDPALKAAKYDEWTKEEKQKLHFVSIGKWLFFSDFLHHANALVTKKAGIVAGLINSDCFLGNHPSVKWDNMQQFFKEYPKSVICQTRIERDDWDKGNIQMSQQFLRLAGSNTQDAWFILSENIPQLLGANEFKLFKFGLGRLGCDNLVASSFNKCGFLTTNFSKRYPVVHNDRVRGGTRTYAPVDLTKVATRIVPDWDTVVSDPVVFLSNFNIPPDEVSKISVKLGNYALFEKLMNQSEVVTLKQICDRMTPLQRYTMVNQILNGYVRISNSN